MKVKLTRLFFITILAVSTTFVAHADMNQSQAYSYTMGVRLGELLKSQGITDLDSNAFAAAIDDVINGRDLLMTEAQMSESVKIQQAITRDQRAKQAQENLKRGREFLQNNAQRVNVVSLDNGMQYRVIKPGKGQATTPDSKVKVHYRGTLINGDVFDSSYDRGQPASFNLSGVIPGFREALIRMRVGDKWEVFIPSDLAYGERGAGGDIGPNETLIFEMELLEIL